ncbi:MAG TPA: DJ-1/PfpI family protein [Anaerolineales bacterium]|nr:DJ-1/PfpI family protein [Anaerolineales bacterium]
MTITIGIYIFDEMELLDFAGPYEVFTTASRVYRRTHPSEPDLFRVIAIGRTDSSVKARAGLNIQPDYYFGNHPPIDVPVIPGGVVTNELARQDVIDWIKKISSASRLTSSVCTGAFLLAQAGLLNGKSATTHWEDIQDLKKMFPSLHVQTGQRWVDEGVIVTSAGISAGIDMSLHLVERLAGRELALGTARQMEFDWVENPAPEREAEA